MILVTRLLTYLVGPLCVLSLLAGAAPSASAATSGATAPAAGGLASSYLMNFDNLTYSTTSTGSLTDMTVNKSGAVSGEMTVNPPLYGTGSLTGKIKGDTITFSALDGDYKGTLDASTKQISGTYTYPGQDGEWTATPASQCEVGGTCKPSKCTSAYEQPTSWDTQRVDSDVPGIDDYREPLNVIISACSTVSLNEIKTALGDWSTVSATSEDVDGLHFKCISPENADVTSHGYVPQAVAWRLHGCGWGNAASLIGTENHVRIWNQPSKESGSSGAWFITASYETACIAINLKLFTLKSEDKHIKKAMKFWHCVDGGEGSFGSEGYNRGAKDFATEVAAAGRHWGWNVTLKTISRPIANGQDVGEDGVKFNGTVYVLTVKLPAN
jgi:hypothetical protein